MRGASGDECGNLVLGQEYNRPAEAGVLKKPRGSDFNFLTYAQIAIQAESTPLHPQMNCKNQMTDFQEIIKFITLEQTSKTEF
jgi:hypothetical protein